MMRLIDADALEKKLQEQREIYINLDMLGAEHLLVHDFLRYVWEAPTIDHVRHGYWKETDDPMFRACSVCGYLEWGGLWNNYCPECGTKMDGGTDNETD